ncbi:ABC transporter permease [Falsihalocynthiibacter arcticus]|uniref:Nitrate ABC transporter permease n=1 Tax=Falsihalocynthiibacter arcticus TaxID=1579316 RepID=A0A126V0D9_9RHOB|nr:ABC transporter permease [Falsihalocynthiibacter arcticus]AML51791.1 nitrate ABC transporter permease [Falsihalocynthiibacter arcticus]
MSSETDTGLDERARLERRLRNRSRLVAFMSHVAVLVVWELAVKLFDVPRFILPAPSEIIMTLGSSRYDWLGNTWVTALEICGGYFFAIVLGVAAALIFSWSKTLSMMFFPLLITLNMIPKVALGPLVIVWFSYGISTNILITFSLCFFPILLTTVRGLREVEPDLLDLVKSLRGSRWQTFFYIQLPGALPYIFSGMKVSAILAVAGAVVGEFIASDRGLGYLMIQVQASLDTPAMFMAVTLITLIGIALYMAVLLVEHIVLPKDARMS